MARRRPAARPKLEALDAREVPAVLTWDGGGGDGLWSNRLNWSADQVPTGLDDVTIDVPGDVTVTLRGVQDARTLVNRETLHIDGNHLQAGSQALLTLRSNSTNTGTIRLESTSNAGGNHSRLHVTGGTLANEGRIEVNRNAGGVRELFGSVTNAGVIAVEGGVQLQLNGLAGATFSQPAGGRLVVADGAEAHFRGGAVGLAGGEAAGTVRGFDAALTLGADVAPGLVFRAHGGSSSLRGTVPAGATVWAEGSHDVAGSQTLLTLPADLTNRGVLRLESTSNAGGNHSRLHVANGRTLTNEGRIEVNRNAGGVRELFGSVTNAGVIAVEGGVQLQLNGLAGATFSQPAGGRLVVADGAEAHFRGGAVGLAGGEAAGTVRGFDAALTLGADVAPGLVFRAHGGSSSLRGTVPAGATVWAEGSHDVAGSQTLLTLPADLTNRGVLRLESTSNAGGNHSRLHVANGRTLTNEGRIEVNRNAGGVRELFGSVTNAGVIAVEGGVQLQLNGLAGATFSQPAGGRLVVADGAEAHFRGGAVGLAGGEAAGTVRGFDAALTLGADVAPGLVFRAHGGSSSLRGTVPAGATVWAEGSHDVAGSQTLLTLPADLTNRGVLRLESTSNAGGNHSRLHVANGRTLTNEGAIVVFSNAGGDREISGKVVNLGLLDVFHPLSINGAPLDNRGLLHVREASINLSFAGTHSNSGFLGIEDSTFTFAGTFQNKATGVVSGTPTNVVGPIANSGLVDLPPESATGVTGTGMMDPVGLPVVVDISRDIFELRIKFAAAAGMSKATVTEPENFVVTLPDGQRLRPTTLRFEEASQDLYIQFPSNFPPDALTLRIKGAQVTDTAGVRLHASDIVVLLRQTRLVPPNTIAPTVVLDLQPDSDTGESNLDNITDDRTPTFDIAVYQPGRIELSVGLPGVSPIVVNAPTAGVYAITSPELPLGARQVEVTFTAVGVPTPGRATLAVTITATTPPSGTVQLDLQAASDTGVSDSDNVTGDASPTFDVTVNQAGRIDLDTTGDGVPDVVVTAASAGVYAVTSPTLADGPRRVTATFTPAGGTAVAAGLDVTIEAAPVAVALALSPASDTGTVGDGVTSERRPQFVVTVDRAGRIDLDVDGDGSFDIPLTAPAGGTYTLTPTADLAAGRRTVQVRFRADAGGTSRSDLDLTIDARPPELTGFRVQAGADQRSTVNRTSWTFSEAANLPALLATPADLTRAFRLMRYLPGGGWEAVAVAADQFRFDADTRTVVWRLDPAGGASLADGFYQWQVYTTYIRDAAGNQLAGGPVLTQSFHRLQGDFDGDRAVTRADLDQVVNSRPGQPGWDAAFDLNGDGVVNARDRLAMGRLLGRQVAAP